MRSDWSLVILLLLLWRGLLEVVKSLTESTVGWTAWDGGWYQNVINVGYQYNPGTQSNVAFFPLFPETTKLISEFLGVNVVTSGLILNFFLTVVTGYIICKFVEHFSVNHRYLLFKKTTALALFISFPTSFFLGVFYADALLVCLITVALYLSIKKMHSWGFVATALAMATKFSALALIPVQVLIYFEDKEFSVKKALKIIGLIIFGMSGLICFMIFLHYKFDNALAFMKAQNDWGRGNELFLISLLKEYKDIIVNLFNPEMTRIGSFGRLFNSLIPFIALAGVYYFVKKKIYWLSLFIVTAVLIPLLSGSLTSLSRYVLILVPVLVAYLSSLINFDNKKQKILIAIYIVLSFCLQSLLCCYFVQQTAFIS